MAAYITCKLTATNRDQLRNPTLGNRVWATFAFLITIRCFSKKFVRTVYYFTASLYVKRRPILYSLKRSSKLSQNSTQQRITDAGVWHLQVRIVILLYCHKQTIYHFMTSSDRFPVPVRSAVKSNFTIWCCQNLSKCALNALIVQASTTELGKLFQIFTMRAEKKCKPRHSENNTFEKSIPKLPQTKMFFSIRNYVNWLSFGNLVFKLQHRTSLLHWFFCFMRWLAGERVRHYTNTRT